MADMTKIQKHMLSLEAVVEMKEKIVNDKAVYYIERAVYLIRQWLNEHTDVSMNCMIFWITMKQGYAIV